MTGIGAFSISRAMGGIESPRPPGAWGGVRGGAGRRGRGSGRGQGGRHGARGDREPTSERDDDATRLHGSGFMIARAVGPAARRSAVERQPREKLEEQGGGQE